MRDFLQIKRLLCPSPLYFDNKRGSNKSTSKKNFAKGSNETVNMGAVVPAICKQARPANAPTKFTAAVDIDLRWDLKR